MSFNAEFRTKKAEGRVLWYVIVFKQGERDAVAGHTSEAFAECRKWQLQHYEQCRSLNGNFYGRRELRRLGLPVRGEVLSLEQCRRLYGEDFILQEQEVVGG